MNDAAGDLLRFIDRSPTPYHAVAEATARLRAAGFTELAEAELWELSPGDARYVVRGGGSLFAFVVGERTPAESGFHVVGAHTDSPNLRVKPLPDVAKEGFRQLAVEPYGGVLLHSWLDRDLSLAGRVTLAAPAGVATQLVDFRRPLLRVPSPLCPCEFNLLVNRLHPDVACLRVTEMFPIDLDLRLPSR